MFSGGFIICSVGWPRNTKRRLCKQRQDDRQHLDANNAWTICKRLETEKASCMSVGVYTIEQHHALGQVFERARQFFLSTLVRRQVSASHPVFILLLRVVCRFARCSRLCSTKKQMNPSLLRANCMATPVALISLVSAKQCILYFFARAETVYQRKPGAPISRGGGVERGACGSTRSGGEISQGSPTELNPQVRLPSSERRHTGKFINSLKLSPICRSASHAVICRMQLTVHATRRTPHGTSRLVEGSNACLVGENPTCSVPAS